MEVVLSNGSTESFDYVVGADGIHSRTRSLVFGEGFEFPLGGRYIGLPENYEHGFAREFIRIYLGTGQNVILAPTSPTSVSAVIYHASGGLEPAGKDTASIKSFLLAAYKDFAPEVRTLFSAIDEKSFIFMDTISQVRMHTIVKDRVALVGDAAHCPTFMSGMGSSLALQGAQLLAQNLRAQPGNPAAALSAYESAVTPIADRYRGSALEMRPMMLSREPWIARLRDLALRVTPHFLLNRNPQGGGRDGSGDNPCRIRRDDWEHRWNWNFGALRHPSGATYDGAGNLYIADPFSHTIRKIVVATAQVTTLASLRAARSPRWWAETACAVCGPARSRAASTSHGAWPGFPIMDS